jgi:hypothetical protein
MAMTSARWTDGRVGAVVVRGIDPVTPRCFPWLSASPTRA